MLDSDLLQEDELQMLRYWGQPNRTWAVIFESGKEQSAVTTILSRLCTLRQQVAMLETTVCQVEAILQGRQRAMFICGAWTRCRQSDGVFVFRCDRPNGHEGDHVDHVLLTNWSGSSPQQDRFASAVEEEVARAKQKFPGHRHKLAALMEEVGELSNALLEHARRNDTAEHVFQEAVQVACMAQQIAEGGDEDFAYRGPMEKR